mmetsp:Transcript_131044/g.231593  ORF Transcript_131044/g.231593 Transcript_131044/m.231593 type:complete len:609 (+) Transcript_131044:119-1945(+)
MGAGAGLGIGPWEKFHLVRTLVASQPDRYHKQRRYDKYRDLPQAEYPIWAIAIAEVTFILAVASADVQVHLWDLETWEMRVSLKAHEAVIWDVCFSPNETTLATASADKTIRLWEADTGTPMGVLNAHTDVVKSLQFSSDGYLLSGGLDCQLAVWEFDNVKPMQFWRAHEGGVHEVAWSTADTSMALAIGADGSVSAWRAFDGEEGLLARFPGGDGGGVLCLAAHPVRLGVVATGIEDGGVWLWFFTPGAGGDTPVNGHHHLRGHMQAVWTLDFTMDGTMLISGSSDCNARIWGVVDLDAPMLLCVLNAHDTWIRSLRWTSILHPTKGDVSGIASASTDGTVSFWSTPRKVRRWSYKKAGDVEKAAQDSEDDIPMSNDMPFEPEGPEAPLQLPWQDDFGGSGRPFSPSAGAIRPISPSRLDRSATRSAAGLISKLSHPDDEEKKQKKRFGATRDRVATAVSSWGRPNLGDPLKSFGTIFGSTPVGSPHSTGGWPTPTPKAGGPPTGMSMSGTSFMSDPPLMSPSVVVSPPQGMGNRPPPPPANAPFRVTPLGGGLPAGQPPPPPPDAPYRVTPLGGGPRAPNFAPPPNYAPPQRGARGQPQPPPLPTL